MFSKFSLHVFRVFSACLPHVLCHLCAQSVLRVNILRVCTELHVCSAVISSEYRETAVGRLKISKMLAYHCVEGSWRSRKAIWDIIKFPSGFSSSFRYFEYFVNIFEWPCLKFKIFWIFCEYFWVALPWVFRIGAGLCQRLRQGPFSHPDLSNFQPKVKCAK